MTEKIELRVQSLNHHYDLKGPLLEFDAKCLMTKADWERYRDTIPWNATDWPWRLVLEPRQKEGKTTDESLYKRKWKQFETYMENFKSSFPEYRPKDEFHDFGHADWKPATWVFHELYKLAKGITIANQAKKGEDDQ